MRKTLLTVVAVATLAILAVAPQKANAQWRRARYYYPAYGTTYVAPAYVTPSVQYVAPTVSYYEPTPTYSYVAPTYTYTPSYYYTPSYGYYGGGVGVYVGGRGWRGGRWRY